MLLAAVSTSGGDGGAALEQQPAQSQPNPVISSQVNDALSEAQVSLRHRVPQASTGEAATGSVNDPCPWLAASAASSMTAGGLAAFLGRTGLT
jgi:hypothetical protein